MTSTRTSRHIARLSFAALVGIGLAGGVAGAAAAAPQPNGGDVKLAPTPTTKKPGPVGPDDLTSPVDPCKKVTHGCPKPAPKPDPKPDPKPEPQPCSAGDCDRPVPGRPTFTG